MEIMNVKRNSILQLLAAENVNVSGTVTCVPKFLNLWKILPLRRDFSGTHNETKCRPESDNIFFVNPLNNTVTVMPLGPVQV